jgi:hypothetical protein
MSKTDLEKMIQEIVTEALYQNFHAIKKRILAEAGISTVDHIEFSSPEGPLCVMDYEDEYTDYATDVIYCGERFTVIGRSPERIRVKAAS